MVAIESVVSEIDTFVSSTGNLNIITLDHMKKMMNNAIVRNIGHSDNEIDLADSDGLEGMKDATSSLRRSFRLPLWSRCNRAASGLQARGLPLAEEARWKDGEIAHFCTRTELTVLTQDNQFL